jgi:quercetin dioxygenase-like cupin family protein
MRHFSSCSVGAAIGLMMLAARVMSGELGVSERAIETTILAQSTQDWGGSPLAEYPQGQPEVTVARVTIPVGMALPLHEHPFMTAGVVLQGVIEVRTDSGKTHIARAGEAVIELIDQPHGGANIGDTDAVILVVYAGIKDQAFTVPVRHGDI